MLDKLEFLIALATERHFRRAAEKVGVSQPTLSAGIKALEETLGVALVNRGARYVGLTPEGEAVLAWGRRLVGDARAMRQDVEVLKRGGLSGEVRLGVIPTALPMAARFVELFGGRHPDVRFTVLSLSSNAILTMLEDFSLDGGLTYLDNEPLPQMRLVPVYDERYRLVTHGAGPFAGRDRVTWKEVGALPLCLFTHDMQNRRIVEEMLAGHGQGPADSMQTNSTMVMTRLVSSGPWSSIMPPVLIDAMPLPDDLVILPIVEPEMTHSVGLAMLEREPVTPLNRALSQAAEALREQVDRKS